MTPNIHDIPGIGGFYTKQEVDDMIAAALAEAKAIDEESMRKHNRDATVISMIDKVADKVENDVMPLVNQAQRYIPRR